MPKKRTSPESSDDDPANKGSDSVFQEDEDSKRAKVVSLSDTTLQDLPIELIECILIKVIVMEVTEMKLVKSERKGKVDPVIDKLRTVCSQWDTILTTDFFRNELNRTFDAQKTIRLEIVHQTQSRFRISCLTTLKDEIFILYGPYNAMTKNVALDVYDCDNMAVVKDVIPLPEMHPICMEACSVSNCIYLLHKRRSVYMNVLRITKDDEHQFNITPLINDVWMPNPEPTLSVAADGSLIFARKEKDKLPVISIYNADGSVKHQMSMHSDIPEFYRITPRANGNLVLVSTDYRTQTTLTEIDMDVTIIRQYQTSLRQVNVCNARVFGRMMLIDWIMKIELLDSEWNFLDVTGPHLTGTRCIFNFETSHFNRDRNELVAVVRDTCNFFSVSLLTIFRFREE